MLSFKFQLVDQIHTMMIHISQLIDKLKKRANYGHDNISTTQIKSAKEVRTKPLTLI